jgi:hypothetical protein
LAGILAQCSPHQLKKSVPAAPADGCGARPFKKIFLENDPKLFYPLLNASK